MSRIILDNVDRSMLRLLQADGAMSSIAVGEKLALSTTPTWRRRKRLEDEGVITGYEATIVRKAIGLSLTAFVQISFQMHTDQSADDFEAVMRGNPYVLSCHKVTGNADYILQIVAADLEAYGEFVERVLRAQPGISAIHSSLALKEIKDSHRLPIPDI